MNFSELLAQIGGISSFFIFSLKAILLNYKKNSQSSRNINKFIDFDQSNFKLMNKEDLKKLYEKVYSPKVMKKSPTRRKSKQSKEEKLKRKKSIIDLKNKFDHEEKTDYIDKMHKMKSIKIDNSIFLKNHNKKIDLKLPDFEDLEADVDKFLNEERKKMVKLSLKNNRKKTKTTKMKNF